MGTKKVLGDVKNGVFTGNEFSDIAFVKWNDLGNHYLNCIPDIFVVMPNHIHGIIRITYPVSGTNIKNSNLETGLKPVSTEANIKKHPLSEMIRAFKTFSTKEINLQLETPGKSFWQKDYYERVIRNEKEYERIWDYIHYNPLRWTWEKEKFEENTIKTNKNKND
ncbi:MAG: hypothetical protein IT281_05625 [Ignavibacteria bacterium]|nr:hypothetical protein [Ignavibacteria bacterium]